MHIGLLRTPKGVYRTCNTKTHAYCYLIIILLKGVKSISFQNSLLSSAHFLGECSLRLDSLRSHAKRPGLNARKQCACSEKDSRAGSPDLSAPFTFLRTLVMPCELSLRRSAAAPVVAPGRMPYSQAVSRLLGVSESVWVSSYVPRGEDTSLIIVPSVVSLTLSNLRRAISRFEKTPSVPGSQRQASGRGSRQCVWMRTATCLNAVTVCLCKHRNAGGPSTVLDWRRSRATGFVKPGNNLG